MEPEAFWTPGRVLAHNLLLRRELELVNEAFQQQKIEWVVLKGLPLAQRVYGSLSQRFCVDNDILVRRRDVERAATTLHALGYAAAAGRQLADDLGSTFQHPMRRVTPAQLTVRLELHWNAFPPHLFNVAESLLWSHLEECRLDRLTVRAFDPALCLVHLASHFVQHRCAEPRVLRDFGLALSCWHTAVSGPGLENLAKTTGTRSAVAFAMLAAHELELTPVAPLFGDPRARAVLRLMSAQALHETGAPGYSRMALSLLLSAPRRWPGALVYELFPPLPTLARITARPASAWLYSRYLPRLARACSKALRGSGHS